MDNEGFNLSDVFKYLVGRVFLTTEYTDEDGERNQYRGEVIKYIGLGRNMGGDPVITLTFESGDYTTVYETDTIYTKSAELKVDEVKVTPDGWQLKGEFPEHFA